MAYAFLLTCTPEPNPTKSVPCGSTPNRPWLSSASLICNTLYKRVKAGDIPQHKDRGRNYYFPHELDAYIAGLARREVSNDAHP